MDKVLADATGDWYLKYIGRARSFVYFLKLDCYTRTASREKRLGVLRSMDYIIVKLSHRRRDGEKIQARNWLETLYPLLGKEAADTFYEEMLSGKTMGLDDIPAAFGVTHNAIPVDQKLLSFGFHLQSLGAGIISGLEAGSAAELAGLKNGDSIITHSRIDSCVEYTKRELRLVVDRNGRQVGTNFNPRSLQLVHTYQVLKIGD